MFFMDDHTPETVFRSEKKKNCWNGWSGIGRKARKTFILDAFILFPQKQKILFEVPSQPNSWFLFCFRFYRILSLLSPSSPFALQRFFLLWRHFFPSKTSESFSIHSILYVYSLISWWATVDSFFIFYSFEFLFSSSDIVEFCDHFYFFIQIFDPLRNGYSPLDFSFLFYTFFSY